MVSKKCGWNCYCVVIIIEGKLYKCCFRGWDFYYGLEYGNYWVGNIICKFLKSK